jgi:FkbM family methyltransferase
VTNTPFGPFRLLAFRLYAWIWRFRLLAFAGRVFGNLSNPTLLRRRFCGRWLHLDVARSNAQRLLYLEGKRFMTELPIVSRLAEVGNVVVDVGANIGYYALLFEKRIGPGGRIIAFEPEPDNLVELRVNVERNGLRNVDIRPCAVGASAGVVNFTRGINGGVLDGSAGATGCEVQVPMTRLDDALSGTVDLIKIDVEGYEEEVLRGALETIKQGRPRLFVEIHPTLMRNGRTPDGVMKILREHYSQIELYQPIRDASAWRKVLARYTGVGAVERLPPWDVVARLCHTGRQDTFWAVCQPSST